jgi:hypothetical protein
MYDENEISKLVYDAIHYYHNLTQELIKERTNSQRCELTDSRLKNEIKYLKDRLSLVYGEFASEKEKQRYENFNRKHIHDRNISKVNSGRIPYLIPTKNDMGTLLYVKCPICGMEEDITDMEAW